MSAVANSSEHVLNGVEVQAVTAVIDAIEAAPPLAQSQYRLSNRWVIGGRSRSKITDFHAGGKTEKHRQEFTLDVDMPAPVGGTDLGPTPGEYLLNALVSCITTTLVYHAAVRGIEIRSLRASVTGDLDLQGFLGLSEDVRRGFKDVRVNLVVDADEKDLKTLESIIPMSPMLDTVERGTRVNVSIAQRQ